MKLKLKRKPIKQLLFELNMGLPSVCNSLATAISYLKQHGPDLKDCIELLVQDNKRLKRENRKLKRDLDNILTRSSST